MNQSFNRELAALCQMRLTEITDADSAALTQFAECRLMAVGVASSYGEDVTQRAFQAVLEGLEIRRHGRRPRLQDIESKSAFQNYMRGVISSTIGVMTRKRGFRSEHLQWDDNIHTMVPGGRSPTVEAVMRNLQEELFPRLRARAPRRLLPTIAAWESVFLYSDRIPAIGQRKYVREVQKLAQEVITDLGGLQ